MFGAIVLALYVSGVGGPVVDCLAAGVLVARVMQSLVHVSFEQTNAVTAVRFSFFLVQIIIFLALIVVIVRSAGVAP